jgi:hypothetical protein
VKEIYAPFSDEQIYLLNPLESHTCHIPLWQYHTYQNLLITLGQL